MDGEERSQQALTHGHCTHITHEDLFPSPRAKTVRGDPVSDASDSLFAALERGLLSPPALCQLAKGEEPANRPDAHPPPPTLLARRFPQMPPLVRPGQHIHLQQLPVVGNVAHPRSLPLDKPRPGGPTPDQNRVTGGVRNHELVQLRPAAKPIPNVPQIPLDHEPWRVVDKLIVHQPKRKHDTTNQTDSPTPPERPLPRRKAGPVPAERHHDGRDQQREKADADNVFRSQSLPLPVALTTGLGNWVPMLIAVAEGAGGFNPLKTCSKSQGLQARTNALSGPAKAPLPLQPLREKDLEQRLIGHVALVGQNFKVLDHGDG